MDPSADEVRRGAAVYNRATLASYDVFVLGLACRFVWRAPRPRTQARYDRHVGADFAARFTDYRLTTHGSVAYFEATRP